jgi:hypothetical protein
VAPRRFVWIRLVAPGGACQPQPAASPTLQGAWHQASASLKRRLPNGQWRAAGSAAHRGNAQLAAPLSPALDPGRRLMPCDTQVGSGGMVGANTCRLG